ncbi:MAG: sugar phosphate isomerase/epimerase family protein [Lachnospirales bacterium]
MRLCYQVATPDVAIANSVTAYQGSIEKSFSDLSSLGYTGVELMTLNPTNLDWDFIENEAKKNNLKIVLICTGEIFGQLKLSYTDPSEAVRREAIKRTKEIIDFASYLNSNINIGRVRGQYCAELTKEETEQYAIEAFQEISDYAEPKNVNIALEPVTIMQTNFINTCSEAKDIIGRVDRSNFKLMMDVFHLNIEEKNLIDTIREFTSINIHVHLADNNRRYPGHCGLDFEKIIKAFKESGYNGDFSTEIYQIPNMELAAKSAIDHLKPIIEKL